MPFKDPKKRAEYSRIYNAKNRGVRRSQQKKWQENYLQDKENRDKYNAYHRKWNKEHGDLRHNAKLKHSYNITLVDYGNILVSQNGMCPMCGIPPISPVVDHSHKTGKVRGIICRRHNIGLGIFNDSIISLQIAIEYLKKYGE